MGGREWPRCRRDVHVNPLLCFPLVNLSFVTGAPAENLERQMKNSVLPINAQVHAHTHTHTSVTLKVKANFNNGNWHHIRGHVGGPVDKERRGWSILNPR